MTTISAIETSVFRLPLRRALRWGSGSRLDALEHVLVEVKLSDGSCGLAEAPPRPTIYGETLAGIETAIAQRFAPRIIGGTAELSELQAQLLGANGGRRGNETARGALDMALHDALAKSAGVSLADHLARISGRKTQPRIRASYILGLGEAEEQIAEARRVQQLGVRVLKVKVSDWRQDLSLLEQLQVALDDDMQFYIDANETLPEDEALAALQAFGERGVLFCEEPIPVERLAQRTALRATSPVPLIADDSCFTVEDLERELEHDTFDVLNIKTARTGYTESLAMLDLARAAGKSVMVGSQAGSGLGAARAAAAALDGVDCPSEVSFCLNLERDILESPLLFEDGYLDVAQLQHVAVIVSK